MKFTDGYWHASDRAMHPLRPEVRRPRRATTPSRLTVYAPTRPIRAPRRHAQPSARDRRRTAPRCADVIRVRIEHHAGGRRAAPAVRARRRPRRVAGRRRRSATTAGVLHLGRPRGTRAPRPAGRADFVADGRVLTVEPVRGRRRRHRPTTARPYVARAARPRRRRARLRAGRAVRPVRQERPERRHLERRRRHAQRAGVQERAVLPHGPRLRRLRQPPRARLVRGRRPRPSTRTQFSVEGEALEYFVVHGPTPKEVLRPLHRADRPAGPGARLVVRAVAVDVVHHRLRRGDRDAFVDGMAERDLPLSVVPLRLLLDARVPLVRLRVGPARPSPTRRGCSRRLHERGLRVCVWINPYIAQRSPLFDEGTRDGATWCADPTARCGSGTCGRPAWPWSTSPTPTARAWYTGQAAAPAATWASTASRPTSASASRPTSSGTTAPTRERMHNYYAQLYNRAVFDAAAKRSAARARPCSSPARRPPAASGSRCTGAATASRRSRRWPSRCAAACPWPVRLRVLEPRHRRLRGHARPGGVQALARLRPALLAQPAARLRLLPRAVGVRRGGRRRRRAASPGSSCASCRTWRRRRRRDAHDGRADDAARWCWSSPTTARPRHVDTAVHARRRPARGTRVLAPRATSSTTCPQGTWTHLLDGRTVTGPRWVRERHGFDSLPAAGPARHGAARRCAGGPPGLRLGGRRDAAPGRAGRRRPADVVVPAPGGGAAARFVVERSGGRLVASGPATPWRLQRGEVLVDAVDGHAELTLA